MRFKKLVSSIFLTQIAVIAFTQSLSYDIRLNQLGFLPNAVKHTAVVNTQADSFAVMTSDLQTTEEAILFILKNSFLSIYG